MNFDFRGQFNPKFLIIYKLFFILHFKEMTMHLYNFIALFVPFKGLIKLVLMFVFWSAACHVIFTLSAIKGTKMLSFHNLH